MIHSTSRSSSDTGLPEAQPSLAAHCCTASTLAASHGGRPCCSLFALPWAMCTGGLACVLMSEGNSGNDFNVEWPPREREGGRVAPGTYGFEFYFFKCKPDTIPWVLLHCSIAKIWDLQGGFVEEKRDLCEQELVKSSVSPPVQNEQ